MPIVILKPETLCCIRSAATLPGKTSIRALHSTKKPETLKPETPTTLKPIMKDATVLHPPGLFFSPAGQALDRIEGLGVRGFRGLKGFRGQGI